MDQALGLLVLVVVAALAVFAVAIGNRAARWSAPVASIVRWAAGVAGFFWIVAAFGFGFIAFIAFLTAALYDPELVGWAVASAIATPVSFLLGLLLFAQARKFLLPSTIWAGVVAVPVGLWDLDDGNLGGAIIAPVAVGLLSFAAWVRAVREG
jgi:hypothetical protein